MKHRVKLAIATVFISMIGVGVMVFQNSRDPGRNVIVSIPAAVVGAPQQKPTPDLAPATQPASGTPAAGKDATVMHTAQSGETVDSLATGLRHKDANAYRDAILNANPSLKADPDKLIAGKTYVIPAAADIPGSSPPVIAAEPEKSAPAPALLEPKEAVVTAAAPTTDLKYTAKAGDTVTDMAGAFLGNRDKAHQDLITDANASLKADPDHVVAGQAYKIPVPDGLAAVAAPASTAPRPTIQPDADQIVAAAAPKTLRYIAQTGDTLTSMAVALLGSDTPEARHAIINNNPSLKLDPDKVIAGQTYSIPAPVAAIDPR